MFYEGDFYDDSYAHWVADGLHQVPDIRDAWGNVNVATMERTLIFWLAWCLCLRGWHSVDRLSLLWSTIHQPGSPFVDKAILMPPPLITGETKQSEVPAEAEGQRVAKRRRASKSAKETESL